VIQTHPYLTQSAKTGVYGYYRRIPLAIKSWFPRNTQFFKLSFKTKDFDAAYESMKGLDQKFKRLEQLVANGGGGSQDTVLSDARLLVERIYCHTSEADTAADREVAERINYDGAVDLLEEGGYIQYGHDGWSTIRNPDDRDPKALAAMLILQGRRDWDFSTNLQDVLDFYLKVNLKKKRNAKQAARVKQSVPSLFHKVAKHLPHGMKTHVEDLERDQVRTITSNIWPNASTRQRNTGTFSSSINAWNTEHPKKAVTNVFRSLVNKEEAAEDTIARRPFTPSELKTYRQSLMHEVDTEIRLAGLMMIELGVSNSEVLGLERRDLKLAEEAPYLIVRDNTLRILGKKRLTRGLPLVGELLAAVRTYVEAIPASSEALFPLWSTGDSSDFSEILKSHITNMRPSDNRTLSPYSARHSFKDRCVAAGAPEQFAQYFMGHKTKGSSGVHDGYGSMRPPALAVDYMVSIANTTEDFGYFED
jgi:integrase